jgi:hypothetical protein
MVSIGLFVKELAGLSTISEERSQAPSTDYFNLTSGYTINTVVWNLTAPDSITFELNTIACYPKRCFWFYIKNLAS